MFRCHISLEREDVGAGAESHDELFQGAVAGALADTVDCTLHLPCARLDSSNGVRDRQAQVIVAVDRDDRLLDVGNIVLQVLDDVVIFERDGIADGVGNIDRRRARIDDRRYDFGKKRQLRPHCVLA